MYKKDAREYALLLVKPDGCEQNLTTVILRYLEKHGDLFEVHRNIFKLSESEVSDTFLNIYNDEKYRSYMTRGSLTAVLLQGENAIQKLRVLKSKIRKLYATDVMENIIHSSEVGNEYDLQFRTFFPNHDINDFCLFADLYSKINFPKKYEEFRSKMIQVQSGKGTKAVAYVFNNDAYMDNNENFKSFLQEDGFSKCTFIGLEYRTKFYNHNIKILGYYKIGDAIRLSSKHNNYYYHNLEDVVELIQNCGGIPFVSFTSQLLDLPQQAYEEMKIKKINGGIVYHPQHTLAQTECLRQNILGNGMITSGGSGGVTQLGRNGVSYEIFSEIYKLLHGVEYIKIE